MKRTWTAVLFIVVCCLCVSRLTEAKKFTFISTNSTIKLKYHRQQKQFRFRLISNNEDGNALTIRNKIDDKLQLQLKYGKIHLIITTKLNEPITSRAFRHAGKQWNDIKINEIPSGLHIAVNNEESVIQTESTAWELKNWIQLSIGSLVYHKSFIGCVDLHSTVYAGSILEERNHVIDGCIDVCSFQTCQNGGKCINNYKNITCDCTGTGYEGATCDKETSTLCINKTYIENTRLPISGNRINRVAFRFKTITQEGLLYRSNLSGNYIKIQLHVGSVYVECQTAGGDFRTNIGEFLHDDQWHSFTLDMRKGGDLHIQLDTLVTSVMSRNLAAKYNSKISSKEHEFILIGQRCNETGTMSPFVGCVQQIYINNLSVIESILNNDGSFSLIGTFDDDCS